MITARQLFPKDDRRGSKKEQRLVSAWQAIRGGRGSQEDAELVFADLADFTDYFAIAPGDATGDQLMRREGARAVMARILFLLDGDTGFIGELRRAALDELARAQTEGET